MANPRCEDGYTRVANELLDAMCRLHLTGNQWMVLHAIIRKTYGWQKEEDWISGSQIEEMTGLKRPRVCEALHDLRARRIILRHGYRTGVQKDYTLWQSGTENRAPAAENCASAAENCAPVTENRNPVTENRNPVTEIRNPVTENRNPVTENRNPVTENRNPVTENRKKCYANPDTQKIKETEQKIERPPTPISDQIHPAVRVYAELTGKKPRRGTLQYDAIARTVTDNSGNVERWRYVIRQWLLAGYKDVNIRGIMDWFTNGVPVRPRAPPAVDPDLATREAKARLDEKLRIWNLQYGKEPAHVP